MGRLNQIIAIEKGVKARVYGVLTDVNKAIQKSELFNGFSKSYQSLATDGEELPAENKKVQYQVGEVLGEVQKSLSELMDVTARKDWTNMVAVGTINFDGVPLIENVPVTYLLFLEKQLNDLRTLVTNIPVLDDADSWGKDENSGLYRTGETRTHRTKKVQRPIVLYDATPEHPAQTQLIVEDVIAGHWTQVKQSGAMPATAKKKLLAKVEKLVIAVKEAREAANMTDEAEVPDVGAAIFAAITG